MKVNAIKKNLRCILYNSVHDIIIKYILQGRILWSGIIVTGWLKMETDIMLK